MDELVTLCGFLIVILSQVQIIAYMNCVHRQT